MSRRDAIGLIERILRRHPEAADFYAEMLGGSTLEATGRGRRESVREALPVASDAVLETIVNAERPVFFAKPPAAAKKSMSINFEDAAILGPDAQSLKASLFAASAKIEPLLARVGRIDIEGLAGMPFGGTGWIIDDGIVVTNRHVAEILARRDGRRFAFRMGSFGKPLASFFDVGHFHGDAPDGVSIAVSSVLYIEPESSPIDIAFLQLAPTPGLGTMAALPIAKQIAAEAELCAIGYPARAPRRIIADQKLMETLYRGVYDVKRVAPGRVIAESTDLVKHDCTTLGGNSGCAVVSLAGEVVGLHFAGVYMRENRAVPARILEDYRNRRRWLRPPDVETSPSAAPVAAPTLQAPAGSTVVTITIAVAGGAPVVSIGGAAPAASMSVEAAASAFLGERRDGVLAARVGYLDDGDRIGDVPCVAVSVHPARLGEATRSWPSTFQGHRVRYDAASVGEQIESLAIAEAVDDIAYDDNARTGEDFAFTSVTEQMTVRAHVSPEYGFEELTSFLADPSLADPSKRKLTSAMYEFKGVAIADLVQGALEAGADMRLAVDNATLPKRKPGAKKKELDPLEFDARERFEEWTNAGHKFDVVSVPEGRRGLIKMAYHIKVTVREDDWFWLSSGNWKNTSSQPIVTPADRERAVEDDLPGNRDWHLVMQSPTLATRFRKHIEQDIIRSRQLLEAEGPAAGEDEPMVFVQEGFDEAVVERPPPSRLLKPLEVGGLVKATPLLTPDRDGRVYTDAVLRLIKSARSSLWFQIPYIGMRFDPKVHRGNIDELIDALTEKLLELDDARVLLRVGNKELSDNRHVAWYFKSKGVDVADRLRNIEDHHTKGMIVDGKRVLIGSHNWSGQGVSVNRDASIIFDDKRLAEYYASAFDIDWQRSTPIRPRRFVKEAPVIIAGSEAMQERPGMVAIPLSEYLAEMDD